MILFGFVTIAVIIIYFMVWNMNIKSSFKADMDRKVGKKPTTFKEDLKELLDSKFHITMLTPTCIAATVFTILPTIFMIALAFTTYNDQDMNNLGTNLFHWNGLQNFRAVFTGEGSLGVEIKNRFMPVLGWTFIWAIFATVTCYFGGIILALLINKKDLKGKKFFRTIFILTIAVPQFISLLAVRNLLGEYGPVNAMLMNWGWIKSPIGFLGLNNGDSEILAKVMVIIVNMWVGIPYTMLMTSGILMNIPADLYEAARVDGTSTTKMFFKITMPYVFFITTPYLISSFIGNINSFNTIFLLTGGGPTYTGYQAGGTDLLVTWLYKVTIDQGSYNTGAVIGIFTFLITATITLVTYRRSKAYNEEDTFQ
jgi:arabinogalactan oligomer/maltooligosaccharide transport system permease protein